MARRVFPIFSASVFAIAFVLVGGCSPENASTSVDAILRVELKAAKAAAVAARGRADRVEAEALASTPYSLGLEHWDWVLDQTRL